MADGRSVRHIPKETCGSRRSTTQPGTCSACGSGDRADGPRLRDASLAADEGHVLADPDEAEVHALELPDLDAVETGLGRGRRRLDTEAVVVAVALSVDLPVQAFLDTEAERLGDSARAGLHAREHRQTLV